MELGVVLDTNVLVPAALRDTLLRSAVRGLYAPYWSGQILDELARVLVREGMTTADKARYLADTLRTNFPAASIAAGYCELIPEMTNDAKDRHVLAAAVYAGAQLIVTKNIRHFPEAALAPYGIAAQLPDDFLQHLFSIEPDDMAESIVRQAEALRYGNVTVTDVIDYLSHDAPRFAAIVRERLTR